MQAAKVTSYEKSVYPKVTDVPVSELSVKIWGDAAWHSQPKGEAAASSHAPMFPPHGARWTKRRWDVDHIQHVRDPLQVAHVQARLKVERDSADPPATKAAWQEE